MHLIDILIGVPILWALYKGLKKGFIVEISGLVALLLGVYGAIHLSEQAAAIIENDLNVTSSYMPIIAWAATFIVIVLLVHLIGKMVEKVIDLASLSFINKLGGGIFSGLKVALILSVILGSINSLDEDIRILPDDLHDNSMLYGPVSSLAPLVLPIIKEKPWAKEIFREAEETVGEVSS